MYNPDNDYQPMLAKLKAICKQKNVSQYALAKATGLSTSSMSCLMNGKTKPYVYTMLMLCDALGISMGDLFANSEISADEEAIINTYRSLTPEKRKMMEELADMLLQYDGEL